MNKQSSKSNPKPTSKEDKKSGSPPQQEPAHPGQEENIEVVPLEIEKASNRVSSNKKKDPKFAENLRWVRDTPGNRGVLFDFIIKRIIIKKVLSGTNSCYLPCCNVFTNSKPTGKGHESVKWNPLLFLFDEKERSKVLTFKKKLRLKLKSKNLSDNEFYHEAAPRLLKYLKDDLKLKKLHELIEGLQRKDGCFHLPLTMKRYAEDCPGPSPLLAPGAELYFKVDLVSYGLFQVNNTTAKKKAKKSKKNEILKQNAEKSSCSSTFQSIPQAPALPLETINQQGFSYGHQRNEIFEMSQGLITTGFSYFDRLEGGLKPSSDSLNQNAFFQTLDEEKISVDSKDSKMAALGQRVAEAGTRPEDLSEEELRERISKLNLLKYHKEQLIKKKKQDLGALRLKANKAAQEIAMISQETWKINTSV